MMSIERVLAALDLDVTPFAICAVAGERGLNLPAQPTLSVHYVLTGSGRLRLPGGKVIAFEPETLIVFPADMAMRIEARTSSTRRSRCVEAALGLDWLVSGDPPYATVIACGRVAAACAGAPTPFQGLHEPLLAAAPPAEPLGRALYELLEEVAAPQLGGRAMAESLMKQALILLLRRLNADGDGRLPWLQALADPQLGPLAGQMMIDPAQVGDLETLARRAGMSRSRFVTRFQDAFGTSPHAFLTRCRLERAARLLVSTDLPVKAVAGHVGYRSRSHFTRAFKNRYGQDPAAWRRAPRASAIDPGGNSGGSRSRDAD